MYIQKVKLQNFRSFGDEGICFLFNKGINAVIGENNNGKTALIDAIRIAFSCVLYKKDIFFSKTDFHVNAAGERAAFAQIDVYLKDVPQNLIEIWDPIQPDCGEFHVVFTLEKTAAGTDKVKYRAWGGKCEGNLLSSDTLEAINLDYLSAWKQVVIEILIRLPSADEECGQWVTNSRDIVHKILVSHNVAMRDGITMNDAIKIKTRDKKHPDFRKIPIRCYFEIKSKAEYTYSSIHGVKGETFDALMLLIHGTVGNTLTPSFLANGKTNTELMRIAYVAMTRPRKLLVVAMPKNKAKLSNRFPPDKWDYVEL